MGSMGSRGRTGGTAATAPGRQADEAEAPLGSDAERRDDGFEVDDTLDSADDASSLPAADTRTGGGGEQADFRDRFDEDLYNDREDRPAQGNTADVAMGEHRFGSEADAYAEYAWRRPGDHHRGDESAVGQSRDPADSRDEGTRR